MRQVIAPAAPQALRAIVRVSRPGGDIAPAVWDYADALQMHRAFWDEAISRRARCRLAGRTRHALADGEISPALLASKRTDSRRSSNGQHGGPAVIPAAVEPTTGRPAATAAQGPVTGAYCGQRWMGGRGRACRRGRALPPNPCVG
ncbi:MAG: hypothetical protein MZV70_08030 [Desulfobacterales bacterium]|nr:hypothetical protein [Desulfobacterales bacterium]